MRLELRRLLELSRITEADRMMRAATDLDVSSPRRACSTVVSKECLVDRCFTPAQRDGR